MVPGMDTESNGVTTVMWPEFCAGQVWQMEGSCIKISLVGKRLVHYKHFLGELKRASWLPWNSPPHGLSFSRMRRYSICPRSPSSPIGPVSGTFKAASSTSPLQVQCATPSFTVTTISFQSCALYLVSCL
jgi:hypothetical protein